MLRFVPVLSLILAGLTAPAAAEPPAFDGPVADIASPVLASYGAFTGGRIEKTTITETASQSSESMVTGSVSARRDGDAYVVSYAFSKMEMEVAGQLQERDLDFAFDVTVSKLGRVLDVALVPEDNSPEAGMRQFLDLIKGGMPLFDAEGVKAGDRIMELDHTISMGAQSIEWSQTGIVLGTVEYEGETLLLVDFTGRFGNEDGYADVRGYGLLDPETAMWILSDVVISGIQPGMTVREVARVVID